MKKIIKRAVILGLILGIGMLLVIPRSPQREENFVNDSESLTDNSSKKTINVRTIVAKKGKLQPFFDLTGDVEIETVMDIYPRTEGKLHSLAVKVGDRVLKDTMIAEVDPSKPGSLFRMSPVLSPITGIVLSLTTQKGAVVTSTTSLGEIGLPSRLVLTAHVPETQVLDLKEGLIAQVRLSALPDKMFSASVDQVPPIIDLKTRTKKIRLKFDSVDSQIHAGMFARIRLMFEPLTPQILVPEKAILIRNDKTVVFIVDGEKTLLREIVKGKSSDGLAEILQGLQSNEVVVIEGQDQLIDGSAIRAFSFKDQSL